MQEIKNPFVLTHPITDDKMQVTSESAAQVVHWATYSLSNSQNDHEIK